jgi:MFS family permease
MGSEWCQCHCKLLTTRVGSLQGVALLGTLCGYILFGLLADAVGRKKTYNWILWIMIMAPLLNATTTWGNRESITFLGTISHSGCGVTV